MGELKFRLGQYVAWKSADGKDGGDGLVMEVDCRPDGTFYLVAGCWVQEELLEDGMPLLQSLPLRVPSPPKPEPPSLVLRPESVEVARISPDGKVWLNLMLDLTQLRDMPREHLLMLRGLINCALGEPYWIDEEFGQDDVKPDYYAGSQAGGHTSE